MQRFKAALPTGNYPGNPEDLVRDDNGDFVLYADVQKPVVDEQKKRWAEAIVKLAPLQFSQLQYCRFCRNTDDRFTNIKHEEGCLYFNSWLYLEGLEA